MFVKLWKIGILSNYPVAEELTDFGLVEMSKDGNQFAFKEIVLHKSKIASAIYSIIGYCDEVEDVDQEVFIKFINQ